MKSVRSQKMMSTAQVNKFIPADQNVDNRNIQALGMTYRSKEYSEVMYTFTCSVSEYCNGTFYVRYKTSTGEIISGMDTYFNLGDCSTRHGLNTPLKNDTIAVSIEKKWEGTCGKFNDSYDEYIVREYALLPSGEIKQTRQQKLDIGRDYHRISTELLTDLDMEEFKAKELTAMINELKATYGFIFQDAKLAKYFKKKDWYQPRANTVDESAYSYIEKRNLELILAYQAK